MRVLADACASGFARRRMRLRSARRAPTSGADRRRTVTQGRGKAQRATPTSKPVTPRVNEPRRHTGAGFTPHGIGSKRDRRRAAAIARRRRTRRRRALIGIPVVLAVIPLGVSAVIYANQKPSITVTGPFRQ